MCIVGEVGSGKSSLLSSILGDLITIRDQSSMFYINESLSYVQ